MIKYSIALWMYFFSLTLVYAQANRNNTFEGTIKYGFELHGDMATVMKAFLPESMTFRFKDQNMAMSIDGGMMASMGNILFLGEKNEAYMIDKSAKKILKMNQKSKDLNPAPPIVVKEAEVLNIAGFPCQKYRISTRDKEGNAKISYLWATEKLQLPKIANPSGAADQFRNFTIKGVNGIPLKMTSTDPKMGTITLTALNIQPEKLSEAIFTLPEDYTLEEFDSMKAGFK
jgi:hypothetical protein